MKKLFAVIAAIAIICSLAILPAMADTSELVNVYTEGAGDGGAVSAQPEPYDVLFGVDETFRLDTSLVLGLKSSFL